MFSASNDYQLSLDYIILCICHTQENFGGGKFVNLANRELFTKNFLTNIHRYTENVFGIYTDCSLFTKFFLTNSFYLYGLSKFSRVWCFVCDITSSY